MASKSALMQASGNPLVMALGERLFPGKRIARLGLEFQAGGGCTATVTCFIEAHELADVAEMCKALRESTNANDSANAQASESTNPATVGVTAATGSRLVSDAGMEGPAAASAGA